MSTMAVETAAVNGSSAGYAIGGELGGNGGLVESILTYTAAIITSTATTTTTTTTATDAASDASHPPPSTLLPSPSPISDLDLAAADWTTELVVEYCGRVVLAVLTSLVNVLVLATLKSTPSLRCATNLVIGSLAVTDLLVGVVSPAGNLIELRVVVCPTLCRMGYGAVMTLSSVSINHLLFVSVDRYLLIARPLHYSRLVTKRRVWIFIGLSWAWATGLGGPFALGFTVSPGWGGACRAELMMPLWLILLLFALHFVLPFFVMLYVYVVIFIVARRQQEAVKDSFRTNGLRHQVHNHRHHHQCSHYHHNHHYNHQQEHSHQNHQHNQHEDSNGSGPTATTTTTTTTTRSSLTSPRTCTCGGGGGGRSGSGSSGSSPGFSGSRAKLRAAQLLTLPCGFFYVSWGPWFFTIIWAVATGSMVQPHGVERLVQLLCILNSLGNPVLYAVSQPMLGRAMLAKAKAALGLLSACLCCRRPGAGGSSFCVASRRQSKQVETSTLMPPESTELTAV